MNFNQCLKFMTSTKVDDASFTNASVNACLQRCLQGFIFVIVSLVEVIVWTASPMFGFQNKKITFRPQVGLSSMQWSVGSQLGIPTQLMLINQVENTGFQRWFLKVKTKADSEEAWVGPFLIKLWFWCWMVNLISLKHLNVLLSFSWFEVDPPLEMTIPLSQVIFPNAAHPTALLPHCWISTTSWMLLLMHAYRYVGPLFLWLYLLLRWKFELLPNIWPW